MDTDTAIVATILVIEVLGRSYATQLVWNQFFPDRKISFLDAILFSTSALVSTYGLFSPLR